MAVDIIGTAPAALQPGERAREVPDVQVPGPLDPGSEHQLPGAPTGVQDTVPSPPYLVDLRRAEQALLEAELAVAPADRYLASYLAAMRTAVTVLAVRARPRRTSGPTDVWQVLAHVAPELGEWAAFFAAGRQKRLLVQVGAATLVSEREADDLLRDAQDFHDLVARRLNAAWRRRPPAERAGT
ncbi:MAG: SAV_6107 family HEPN domain-containing protein [Propionibacteriaceae bacterium]